MADEKGISISDIAACSICPMKMYLAKSDTGYVEPISYSVAKQVSYHLGDVLDVKTIFDELELTIPGHENETKEILETIVNACSKVTWRRADEYDVLVRSEKYKIFGRIDRLFDDSFSIIKSGNAPTHGIYSSNRIQSACCSICLEEMYGHEFYGRIEYLGSGTIRSVITSPSDKRAFLTALKSAEKILRGEIPKVIRGGHCKNCRFANVCTALEKPKTLFEKLRK